LGEQLAREFQQLIARTVSQGVVQGFEIIHVHHDDRQFLA
jgi:hypothetical protein